MQTNINISRSTVTVLDKKPLSFGKGSLDF